MLFELIALVPFLLLVIVASVALLLLVAAFTSPGQNPAWAASALVQAAHQVRSALRSRHACRGLAAGCVVGALVASAAVYAAWSHNPQQSIHGPSGVALLYLAALALSWFLVAGSLAAALVSGLSVALGRLRGLRPNKVLQRTGE